MKLSLEFIQRGGYWLLRDLVGRWIFLPYLFLAPIIEALMSEVVEDPFGRAGCISSVKHSKMHWGVSRVGKGIWHPLNNGRAHASSTVYLSRPGFLTLSFRSIGVDGMDWIMRVWWIVNRAFFLGINVRCCRKFMVNSRSSMWHSKMCIEIHLIHRLRSCSVLLGNCICICWMTRDFWSHGIQKPYKYFSWFPEDGLFIIHSLSRKIRDS